MPNPFDQFDGAPQSTGPVYGPPPKAAPPPTPFQIEDQGFQRDNQRRAAEDQRRQADKDARELRTYNATHDATGKPLPTTSDSKPSEFQSKSAGFYGRMLQSNRAFGQVPEGSRDARTLTGEALHETAPGLENTLPVWLGGNSSDRQLADNNALDFVRASLRQESGASINADEEIKQYRIFFPMPGDTPDVLAQKAAKRAQAIEGFRIAAGPEAAKIEATMAPVAGANADQHNDPATAGTIGAPPANTPPGGTPPGATPGSPPAGTPPFSNGDPGFQRATGDTRMVADPQTQAHVDAMLRQGVPYDQVNRYAIQQGMAPVDRREYAQARKFLLANPGYKDSLVNAHKYEPVTPTEKAITAVGDNPVGSYLVNAGQFLSGNTLDNLAGDPARARQSMDVITNLSPNAATAGQVSGGVLAGMTGEAGLARAGMAGGFARSTLADLIMGSANGAGMADNGSRLAGAARGGASALAGSVGGQAVMRGAGRVLSPSGGNLSELYSAGVRPTIGQRFANVNDGRGFTGTAGRAVNATEEALQSVPIVGSAIRGARQEARDQFQVGAFNQALSEIGEELPKGMRPGTDPHKFTQAAFSQVYDKARSGMTMVADDNLYGALGDLVPEIETLGPQAQNKLRAIMANSVNNRLVGGQMTGDAYKQTQSDLGKHIARLGKSQMAEDQHLAEVLTGVQSAIDAAARRSSHPDAVALLDAADAGYAKLVRIEEAAKTRGGDAGTFSPANFDSSVQKTSGGVRSKSYLRGDANMQDYAAAGRSLEDRMPNSGTSDRAMVAGGLTAGAAGYLHPGTLGLLGAIGAAYAPGVRRVMQGAMAPTNAAGNKAIAAQLRKRAQLLGRPAAAIGVVRALGTSPGQ